MKWYFNLFSVLIFFKASLMSAQVPVLEKKLLAHKAGFEHQARKIARQELGKLRAPQYQAQLDSILMRATFHLEYTITYGKNRELISKEDYYINFEDTSFVKQYISRIWIFSDSTLFFELTRDYLRKDRWYCHCCDDPSLKNFYEQYLFTILGFKPVVQFDVKYSLARLMIKDATLYIQDTHHTKDRLERFPIMALREWLDIQKKQFDMKWYDVFWKAKGVK
jgi:hypothetical protein